MRKSTKKTMMRMMMTMKMTTTTTDRVVSSHGRGFRTGRACVYCSGTDRGRWRQVWCTRHCSPPSPDPCSIRQSSRSATLSNIKPQRSIQTEQKQTRKRIYRTHFRFNINRYGMVIYWNQKQDPFKKATVWVTNHTVIKWINRKSLLIALQQRE